MRLTTLARIALCVTALLWTGSAKAVMLFEINETGPDASSTEDYFSSAFFAKNWSAHDLVTIESGDFKAPPDETISSEQLYLVPEPSGLFMAGMAGYMTLLCSHLWRKQR